MWFNFILMHCTYCGGRSPFALGVHSYLLYLGSQRSGLFSSSGGGQTALMLQHLGGKHVWNYAVNNGAAAYGCGE